METRRRLLQAAVELFATRGFNNVSMQDVVKAAGVTKGAFYHHFESKAHLILAIHNKFVDMQIRDIDAILEQEMHPVDTLAETIKIIFRNMIVHKESVSLFIREYPEMPESVDQQVRKRRLEYERKLIKIIDRGRDSGHIASELPTNIVLYGILGMCVWATQWYDPQRAPAPEVIGTHYAAMLLQGLTPRPAT